MACTQPQSRLSPRLCVATGQQTWKIVEVEVEVGVEVEVKVGQHTMKNRNTPIATGTSLGAGEVK